MFVSCMQSYAIKLKILFFWGGGEDIYMHIFGDTLLLNKLFSQLIYIIQRLKINNFTLSKN